MERTCKAYPRLLALPASPWFCYEVPYQRRLPKPRAHNNSQEVAGPLAIRNPHELRPRRLKWPMNLKASNPKDLEEHGPQLKNYYDYYSRYYCYDYDYCYYCDY